MEAQTEVPTDAPTYAAKTATPATTTRTFAPATQAIPLPAAMGYCARRVLEALDGGGDVCAQAAFNALSASTRELLAWWFGDAACRGRRRNFHVGQREAILHTILAHELFRSDDPQRLFREACGGWPALAAKDPPPSGFASYRLRMAPGAGVRWVVQALWLWQWAGDAEQRAFARHDAHFGACFDGRATVLTGDRAAADRFADALLGPRDAHGVRVPANGRFARDFDVFAPPRLRAPLLRWLSVCAAASGRSPLRIAVLDERDAARRYRTIAPLRMIVGDGAHALAQNADAPASRASAERDAAANPHYRSISRDVGIECGGARETPARMLWLEFDDGVDDPPAEAAVLTDLPLARAMRIGASKSVLLVETDGRTAERARTVETRYRRGRRPVLPCRHRPPLDTGLRLLERFDRETLALRMVDDDPAPPALLVLCEDPHLRRAVVAYAHARGVGRALICDDGNADDQRRARVLVDTLPPQHAAMQARCCAVVVLRERGSDTFDGIDAGRLFAPALAPRWRERAYAEFKAEDRECIANGRTPGGLIDSLPAIAAHWAAHGVAHERQSGAACRSALPLVRVADIPNPAGDLRVVGLRDDYREYDFALPDPAAAASGAASPLLSACAHRTLRAPYSMPAHKCIYTHQGWPKRSDGMERGLIEMADADPHIAAFCLFDTTQRPWHDAAERTARERTHAHVFDRETMGEPASIAQTAIDAPPACPHALIRTAGYVYALQFAPALPLRTSAEAEPPGVRAARDAMAAWCRRVNALPGDRRQYREWRPVQVQAPLFWSWKRRGGTLSSLLSALAETTPITTHRPRLAQPLDDAF
ncbi:MAG: hypothetical protein KA144_11630 [Xanthomonadaceae bacterium]|nr:hypothetical protein [Xanthomonadaceae bacterium]